MAIKGYRKPLEAKDLWSLNQRDSSKVMVPRLLKEWEKEQAKSRRYVLSGGIRENGYEGVGEALLISEMDNAR